MISGEWRGGQDQFEALFRRADLDGDGKISGAEAVSFFQGSNLPKQVLAQIWTYADQSHSGFLGHAEFYNALKLVTVAQSKRDLTPEIVKAALYGPAAAKIPPPQINLSAIPPNRASSISGPATPSQISMMNPTASQNLGFRGPGVPNVGMNQQYFPTQQNLSMRPPQAISPGIASLSPHSVTGIVGQSQAMPTSKALQTIAGATGQLQAMPTGTASHPPQSLPGATPGLGISKSNLSNNWLSGQASSGVAGPRGISPSTTTGVLPQALASVSSQSSLSESKTSAVSGNGMAGNSFFGGDVFSAATSTIKGEPSRPSYSATSMPMSSPIVPVSSGTEPSMKSNSLDSLQSAFATQPLSSQPARTQSLPNLGQQVLAPTSSKISTSGISGRTENSSDSQISWPKMKPSDIQKYTKVFMEVDMDRDGRITGEQARNLFLSWRLPREVLKQVWDLSDQDSDSMLSLREFCFALYLMERYREGRPLPSALPSNVMFDETLLSMTGQQSSVAYGNSAWGPNPGFGQQPGMSTRPMAPTTGLRPPVPVAQSQPGASAAFNQQKSGAHMLEDSFLNQHGGGDQNSVNSAIQDPATDKKVTEPEKVILDSKEKIEYYRTKMQELVLYKSRCDNKLNEITERALSDKREAEMLGKKYEDKYKQVAEVASKLTIEEATFREMQGRKIELNQAIVNVEQGGSADGLLQVRDDRIQSDLDELMKALTERSKKHGLEVKSATLIELPVGWQPGIQESASTWDEDWDKFEDKGFSNDLTVDVKSISASSMPNSHTAENGKAYADGNSTPDSLSNGDGKSGYFMNNDGHGLESESAYTHSEDELVRTPQGSPAGRTSLESPQDFSDVFVQSTEADAEAHSGFNDSTWGAFDTNDDVDSVWGFNPATTKDSDSEKQRDIFGADDFGLQPIRTESPSTESAFQKKSLFFEDSIPASPASRFGNSPRYSEAGDHFDNYSRFDTFSMHEGGFSPQREKHTRFDSINSTKDFSQSRTFSSFDDSDPFGFSGPFRVSADNQTPKKGSENWGSF